MVMIVAVCIFLFSTLFHFNLTSVGYSELKGEDEDLSKTDDEVFSFKKPLRAAKYLGCNWCDLRDVSRVRRRGEFRVTLSLLLLLLLLLCSASSSIAHLPSTFHSWS